MAKKKDLVIIGAGPGGYAAAFRAADLGLRVTLIDPEINPGGVCLYRGCIPSKALLHLTQVKQEAEEMANKGLNFGKPEIDIDKIRNWKNEVVEKLTNGLGQLSKSRKVEFIRGTASFISEKVLQINTEDDEYEMQFNNLIVATGSKNASLPGLEVDHTNTWDSTDALDLKEIPKKLLVIGGGYIGLELGSVYANLGSNVSVAEMTDGFLPGADRDLVKIFEKEHPFEELYFKSKVTEITEREDGLVVNIQTEKGDSKKLKFDKVLIAIGRQPNTAKLEIQNSNIQLDKKGFIKVDRFQKTNIENIYAIGDLTGEPLLAHNASYEGRITAEVISGRKGAAYDAQSIPGIVFTNPQIAWCGLTETQAKEQEIKFKILKFPWSASGRAVAIGNPNGLTKLIVDKDTGAVLGGGVAGKNAGSLIPEISFAIEMGAKAEDISLSIHPHPTLSETIMEAAEIYSGSPTHISV